MKIVNAQRLEDTIRELAGKVADELGVELLEVRLLGRGKRTLLRVTIDREGGVTLDDCETFSRRFEGFMDVEDFITGAYTLEVSSPGLDRPLKTLNDFERSRGKLVRVTTREKIHDQSFFIGRLRDVHDGVITLFTEKEKTGPVEIEIPYDIIAKAQLEIEVS